MDRNTFLKVAGAAALLPGRLQAGAYRFEQTDYKVLEDFDKCLIKGRIKLTSRPPQLDRYIKVTADNSFCGNRIVNRALVTSNNRTIEDVIVWLETVPAGKAAPRYSPVISDWKCDFYPKAIAVSKGQKIVLHNGDPIYNDFRAVVDGKVLFNIAVPMKNQKIKKRMKRPGMVDLYCNVHPWEHALILVCPHPYFGVTKLDGKFSMPDVPAGKYTLVAMHQVLGEKRMDVEVTPDRSVKVDLEF